ncbi:MAG: T9SS type A sorting domain-containing protein [Flavobacterium sp.]|nr:T9SS type A sorting domain-containing protein [Flavobacterium sp.]
MTKRYILKTITLAILFVANSFGQTTITQWNFNGAAASTIPSQTNFPTLSTENGKSELIGTTFAVGNITSGTLETETAITIPNFAWNTIGFSSNEKFGASKTEFKIYPNPSNKEVVYLNQSNDVQVFDILGKQVFLGNNITSIDTSDFQSGIYFVKTKSGITRKLVVR